MPLDSREQGGLTELVDMLAADIQSITDLLRCNAPDVADAFCAVMEGVHQPLLNKHSSKPIRIALIGDCIMTEISSFLEPLLFERTISIDYKTFYFSSRMGEGIDTQGIEEGIASGKFDLIALSFLTFEGLPLYTHLLQTATSGKVALSVLNEQCDALLVSIDRYIAAIRARTNTPILLHGCSGLPLGKYRRRLPFLPVMSPGKRYVVERLNAGLRDIAGHLENILLIDEQAVVARAGHRYASQHLLPHALRKNAYIHHSRFGMLMAEEYAHMVNAYYLLANTKVLLVDFDNTLWQGVMADGPVVHDVAGQQLLKELQQAGILLVSLSKNDPRNIRWEEMQLQPDDFVLHKISWDAKPQAVLEVASVLDLDPRSFVMLDDNPVERELVTTSVQGITAFDPLQPSSWQYLRWLLSFPATRQTEEAGRRTSMYREAAQRREAQAISFDYDAMMHSLELKVGWRLATHKDLDRLHELISRTNQFNTTTIRYSQAELEQLLKARDHGVFVATLSDKFGSLGIVGSVICRVDNQCLIYESVVMSCRAMGFGLESLLISMPVATFTGIHTLVGTFTASERNSPCADLFHNAGFVKASDHQWYRPVSAGKLTYPTWLHLSGSGEKQSVVTERGEPSTQATV
ncbi:hypothetical protein WH50_02130 [Pokkaliibacter plantistimulans]|uniref:HAD-IIIC family phosphatase n=2 Tax=Pokkaliibacter plantistimulans TaxID=1635171 RepID=A0ABX5M7H9_9GAMM|nr:hypothetical protein WH50_02130 [Pokkaliibacter plantistimulans]